MTKQEKLEKMIHSMEEFQKEFFPNDVGKKCPYCGNDISTHNTKNEYIIKGKDILKDHILTKIPFKVK